MSVVQLVIDIRCHPTVKRNALLRYTCAQQLSHVGKSESCDNLAMTSDSPGHHVMKDLTYG